MKLGIETLGKGVLVAAYGAAVAVGGTLYGALHDAGHQHGGVSLHGHDAEGVAASSGHAHPDAALLLAAAGLGLVALTWVLMPPQRRRILPAHLALCTVAAATIHFAVLWPHARESVALGALFGLAGAFQLVWAPTVLLRPSRGLLVAASGFNVAIALAWALSRTLGLPFGPGAWTREPVGLADAAATAFELGVAAGALVLLASLARPLGGRAGRLATQAPVVAIAIILLVSLTLL